MEIQTKFGPVRSSQVRGPLHGSLLELKEQGFKTKMPLWLNALLRENSLLDSSICTSGNIVMEGILYSPEKNPRLLPFGLCLAYPSKAAENHEHSEEYLLKRRFREEYIGRLGPSGLEIKSSDLGPDGHLHIPIRFLGESIYSIWLFGGDGTDSEKSKRAQNHADWILDSRFRRREITLYLDNPQYIERIGEPYANQLFYGPVSSPHLIGNGLILHNCNVRLIDRKPNLFL
jgi:hypothetical protein